MSSPSTITIDSHIAPDDHGDAVTLEIVRAMTTMPKTLGPKWLYDDRGSELFEQITRLPEYYPTEAERSILTARADEIVSLTGATTVIELGSGTSDKTRTLLDAFAAVGALQRFIPFDVSEQTLIDAASMLAERYPGLEVHGVVGDFNRHLGEIPKGGRRLLAFLGSTIGNFHVPERQTFLRSLANTLDTDDWLLLGLDLMKDVPRIIDAYNDPAGVSEAFAVNVINVLNREFDGNLPVDQFVHVPYWDPIEERIDSRLRVTRPMFGRFDALDLDVAFNEGEELRIEVSAKFRPERIEVELADAGFDVEAFWTADGPTPDARPDFGLILARRR